MAYYDLRQLAAREGGGAQGDPMRARSVTCRGAIVAFRSIALAMVASGVLLAPALRAEGRAQSGTAEEPGGRAGSSVSTPSKATNEAAAPNAERRRVLVLDLTASGVESRVADVVTGSILESLSRDPRVEALGARDLKQLIELEASREAMSCDTSSCLADLAGAMGARYVVFGTVTGLDEQVIVRLSLFDSDEARPIARGSADGASVDVVLSKVDATVGALLSPLGGAPPPARPAAATVDEAGSSLGPIGATVAGVGAAALAVGAITAAVSTMVLRDPDAKGGDKGTAVYATLAGGSLAIVGLGSAAVGAGLLTWGVLE